MLTVVPDLRLRSIDPPAGTVSELMVMLLQPKAFDSAEYVETVQPWASTPIGELAATKAAAMYPQIMLNQRSVIFK